MSTVVFMPPIGPKPIPGRVAAVRRMPGHYVAEGDPVVDLALLSKAGTHYLTICAPFSGKIMRCRELGEWVKADEHVIEVTSVGSPTLELFIAYRRDDAPGHAGWVGEGLIQYFGPGQVFKDVQTLKPGQDFATVIRDRLQGAFVMVVIIGPNWVTDGRLHDLQDLHREEIRTALERKLEVIPVLVNGATIPKPEQLPEDIRPLIGRIVVEMTDTRWAYDLATLRTRLEEVLANSPARRRFLAQVQPYEPGPRWQWIEDNPKA